MPRSSYPTGEKWAECDRCGFDWPESELQEQRGLWLCHRCFDKDYEEPTVAPTITEE